MGGAILYGSGSRTDFYKWNIPSIGAIWFLLALFWSVCFLTGILYLSSNYKKLVKVLLILGICIVLFAFGLESAKFTWLPCSIQAGAAGTLFLALGYLYKSYENNISLKSQKAVFIVLVAIWFLAIYRSEKFENLSLVRCYFPDVVLNVLGAVGGSIFFVLCSREMERREFFANRYLTWIGKNSLIVLCVHNIEFNFLPWNYFINMQEMGDGGYLMKYILEMIVISVGVYTVNLFLNFIRGKTEDM